MQELAELYKALADETRLSILTLLSKHGELCVCDVVGVLGITQSKASRHLRYLRNAGLVLDRREGTWSHYRLDSELDGRIWAILEAMTQAIPPEELERLEQAYANWDNEKGCVIDDSGSDEVYLKDEKGQTLHLTRGSAV